ncbi:chitosanase [Fusarium austroafricanum]|uniref:Endo-chitosanase n=1 Tax=Fusarium austroafricanum TaxID=2364996 RepID=A0A8H4KT98_9HYPO|nr:chitosanase [Fusarium austroafricanum]
MHYSIVLFILTLSSAASAYKLPQNLKSIYDSHKSSTCSKSLSGTFSGGARYCGDISGAIYLKGSPGNNDNMDIDCDGANNHAGACANDPTGQSMTAFQDIVRSYGISGLDANVHPNVPLSVMAAVCNGEVHYGVWGDTNGGTSTGEASISLANLCFPNDGLNGDKGHDEKDVLYIAFKGNDAVPGKHGAKWNVKDRAEFSKSIKAQGDKLVAKL